MNETDLAELLRSARVDPPPASSIDIARARADGTRKLRRRRGAVSLAAGVAVLVLVGGVAVAVNGSRPVPTIGGPSRTPAAVVTAPARFDALRMRIATGWLPPGMMDRRYEVRPTEQLASFVRWGPVDKDGSRMPEQEVVVTAYAAGVGLDPADYGDWRDGGRVMPSVQPGPSISGSTSTWYGDHVLAWRWAPDAWATVLVRGTFDTPAREVVEHVATTVRTDVDVPVTVPFTVAAPPAPLELVRSLVSWSAEGRYDAHLAFSDMRDETDPVTRIPRLLLVTVAANPSLTGDFRTGPPTSQLDGHPAIVDFTADGGRVLILGVNGTWVDVWVYDPVTMSYVDQEEAVELARGIAVGPRSTDPSTWTSTPIRSAK